MTSFNKLISLAKKTFSDDSVLDAGHVDAPLLLVGLMYREASRAMEVEPEVNDGKFPDHLLGSPFGVAQIRKLESLINRVVLPS